ncbi:ATP-binding protein [Limosilactobacillus sp. STM2_1]|uniref:ATP-binding protein n=1 Tax=Limosilactobacillus rudii TaxID=2759755 RepID=A0A7W3UKB8_9LACO|nr:ATP-binding protein [Limosilactobacillus rudii]MBB1078937.1 ATP-binding protein [Limosilactobacillus rudii]MBB1097118.1 ATP-binding protein [Limosilactobacillus rudii]MCD7134111.1 ATP-binding protein [Limosilactobacillus rudii]
MTKNIAMEVLQAVGNPEKFERLAEEHGVDLKKAAATQEDRNKAAQRKYEQMLTNKKNKAYRRYSLYSGNKSINFSFNQWKPEMQSDNEKAKLVAKKCHQLARSILDKNQNVVLSGKPGVGKTSLALAMLNYVAHRNKTVMVVSTMELLRLLRDRYERPELRQRIEDTMRGMKEADVLLLDDFGTEGGMKESIKPVHKDMQDEMYSVSNARFDEEENAPVGSIIITTNNTLDELHTMYNDKLLSRLIPKDKNQIVVFDKLDDVRGKK